MNTTFLRSRTVLVAAALALLTIPAIIGVRLATADNSPSMLSTVPASMYQQAGVTLAAPSASEAASDHIGQTQAIAAVDARWGGTTIREAKLLDVAANSPGGPIKCLCWVVSSMPKNGIMISGPGAPAGPARDALEKEKAQIAQRLTATGYHLDFIDAKTGAWLAATEGGQP